ncbi:hypothetical protein ACE2AJ_09565 [Aquihabitans daechungensis]|uniref:hypothetical protein n=1 Tax=Aquihabitans daechungensis TaxID=1052257 RepID=UPI003B9F1D8F
MDRNEPAIDPDLRRPHEPASARTADPATTIERDPPSWPGPAELGDGADWVRDRSPSDAHRQRRVRGILAAAVIVGVLLLGLVSLSRISVPETGGPLDDVVRVAVNPPVQARPEPDRPVLHVVCTITDAGSGDGIGPDGNRTETWHAWRRADGSGREDRGGHARTIPPAIGIITPDEAQAEDLPDGGSASMAARTDGTAGSFGGSIGGYPINQALIDELPRHPGALRARLLELVTTGGADPTVGHPDGTTPTGPTREAAAPDRAGARNALLFRGATDLLVSWLAPPALRSAALEIIGEIDGVRVETGTDEQGQELLILALGHDGRTEVFVDPVTSAVTGRRITDADGTITHELHVVAADWVASVPDP